MGAEMISYPNTALTVLGERRRLGRAAILASESAAKRLGLMGRAVKVRCASALPTSCRSLFAAQYRHARSSTAPRARPPSRPTRWPASGLTMSTWSSCTTSSPPPRSFTTRTSAFCGEGEAGRLIDDGETAHGGRIPVNVSGGLLSKGHPLGADRHLPTSTRSPPTCAAKRASARWKAPASASHPRGWHGFGPAPSTCSRRSNPPRPGR